MGQKAGISGIRVYVGQFSRDATLISGNQAIAGVGFTPKAVIFFMSQTASTEWSLGFSDGISQKDLFGIGTDNLFRMTTPSIECIEDYEDAGKTYFGRLNSFDIDGFTISWVKTGLPVGTIGIIFLAIG